jgi:hypothetical protein
VENLYKNFIKLNIMSNLNFENIVGFKAVDKDGNEQNVTVDEMVDMVSTRMVMALSETSTFAAAAATGNDVYENELPTVTDAANVRVLQSSGDAAKMTMQSLASKLGELIGTATANKDGLMPAGQVFTSPSRALNAGQVCLLSTSEYSVVYNVVVWHPWRGIASYHILLSNDSSKATYKVIALSNLSSQKFYVTISDDKTISIYLENNSEGPMNLSIQPVTSFRTTPVIATLPEDAIEVVVE